MQNYEKLENVVCVRGSKKMGHREKPKILEAAGRENR